MPAPVPGPYDEALAAIGVQINALTQDLKALKEGHAGKADLDAIRADLAEARAEFKALKEKATEKPPKLPVAEPAPEDDGVASGFWL